MSLGPRSSAELELCSYSSLAEFRLGLLFTQPNNKRHSVSTGNVMVQTSMRMLLPEGRLFLFAAVFSACSLLCSPASHSRTAHLQANPTATPAHEESTEDYNRRLQQLNQSLVVPSANGEQDEYRIGAHDLLEINVFEAPDLNRSLRVSAGGEISMPSF